MTRRLSLGALAAACLFLLTVLLPGQRSAATNNNSRWLNSHDMREARAGAAAATLPDGRVLVTGGTGASGPLTSAEFIHVPVTSAGITPAAVAPMGVPRSEHISVALKDGRVLVAGGRTTGGAGTNAAEIFDPRTGAWTAIAPMQAARIGATATTLHDGTTLIAGGETGTLALATLERFDPATLSFNPVFAVLSSPRQNHAAALLPDGRVLIAGGFDGSATLDTLDVYDPAAATVTALGKMSTPRQGLSATTLLNGRVLLAGGNDGKQDLDSTEIFDPKTASLKPGPALVVPRSGHMAFRIPNNNAVMIAGGTSAGQPQASIELYRSWNNTLVGRSGLSIARHLIAGAPAGAGAVAVAGGKLASGAVSPVAEDLTGPWVATDKPDYQPGDTVQITGGNWTAGQTVTMTIVEDPDDGDGPHTLTSVVDSTGSFTNTFPIDTADLGVTFTLTAADPLNEQASITFTDATNLNGLSVGAQSPSSVTAGSSASYTVTLSFSGGGSCSALLFTTTGSMQTGLPAGTSASFSPNPVVATATSMPTSTLTITTTSGTTPSGSFTFTVDANPTTGCGGGSSLQTFSATLVVGGKISTTTTVTSSASPSTYSDSVTFMATVAPASGSTAPTGTVQFVVDGSNFGSAVTVGPCAPSPDACATSGATTTLTATTHTVTATYTATGSFTGSPGTLAGGQVVKPKALTITAKDASKTYGQTVTFAGTEFTTGAGQLVNGDSVTSVTLTSAGAAATATVAGSPYTIVPSAALGTGLGNYTITYANGSLTVNTAPLTITAKNQTKTYGSAFAFTGTEFTTTGTLYNGDSVASVTLTSAGAAATATVAGSPYSIVPSAAAGTGLGNYTISYINGNFTVNAAPLTITAKNQTKTYGSAFTFAGAEFTATGTLYNGDTVTSATLTSGGSAATATVAGSPYSIVPSAAVGSGLANYNITYVNGSFTVNAAPLTITAKDQNKTYGSAFTFTGTEFSTTGTLYNGDSVASVTLTSAAAAATATVAGSPYSIVPSAAVGSGLGNYTITYANGSFTVNTAPLTITAKNQSKTYGSAFTFTGTEFTAATLFNGDTVTGVTLNSGGAAATATVAGSPYSIVPSAALGSGLGNYTITYVNGSFTVNTAPLTITAKNQSKTYGSAFTFVGTEFTAATLFNGDTVTGVALTSGGAAATATVAGSPYSIVPSAAVGSGLGNYTISYVNGSFTVNPAALTITAKNQSKTYGATFTFAGTEFTTTGTLYNGDTVTSVTLTSAGAAATATVAGSPYSIAPSAAVGTGVGNYTITYANGSLTVNQAPLTVTAKDQSKTYGSTFSFTGTEFTTSGTLYNGDSVASVTLTSAGAPATATVAGSPYDIVPSAAAGSGVGNYTITYANGKLTVNPAPLTITAKNQSKTYGSTFAFTGTEVTAATLYNGDSVTSVTLTSAGAPATATVAGSPYDIVPSAAAGTGLGNYTISYSNGKLTVNPAPLTITAKNQSKTYGSTFAFTGTEITAATLYNGDSVTAVTLTSAAAAATATVTGSPYSIVPSAAVGSGLANYTISYVNGSLTVNPAPLTITAKNQSKTYGSAFTFGGTEFSATGTLYNGDTVTSVMLTSAGAPATATVLGSPYSIVPSAAVGSGLGNYTITYVNGTFTVNPATVTATVTASDKQYNGTNTATIATCTVAPLFNGDTVTCSDSATFSDANVGNLKTVTATGIILGGPGGGNYVLSSNTAMATASITPAPLTITAKNQSKTYGSAFTFTGTEIMTTGTLYSTDSVTGVTLTSGGAAATSTVAGSPYSIVPSAAVGSGLGNYNITYVNGTFTVNPAPLTVTAKNQNKSYGSTFTFTGTEFTAATLFNGDTVTGVTLSSGGAAATATVAGSPYSIVPSAAVGSGLANYTISYVNGSFTVNPAPLTITAKIQAKTYGSAFTFGGTEFTATGTLYNGDTVTSVTLTSAGAPATATVLGSPYSIVPSAAVGSGLGNYTITYVNGSFTVSPATVTATVTASDKVYNGTNTATIATCTVAPLFNGDTVTCSDSATFSDANVGNLKTVTATGITLGGPGGGNYVLSSNTATTKASITPAPTSTTLLSSSNPSVFPLAITFTATVQNTSTPPIPLGTVTFVDGAATLATGVPLTSGVATFTTSPAAATALSAGSHPITVMYTPASPGNFQASASGTLTQVVNNVAPVVTITGPPTGSIAAIGAALTFTGSFTDTPGDTHTATWLFSYTDPTTGNTVTLAPVTGTVTESPSGGGSVTTSYAFAADGVYNVKLDVTDFSGAKGSATQLNGMPEFVVIYNPNAGFVTGGGWINSQPGSMPVSAFCSTCAGLSGKASFGFNAQYKKGQSMPDGQTQFQFQVGNLDFHSTSYQWLVVSGPMAQYKGNGTINGSGNYQFMLTARDGSLNGGGGQDGFRMQVWDANNVIIYDNMIAAPSTMTTANVQNLDGGSIVIHSK